MIFVLENIENKRLRKTLEPVLFQHGIKEFELQPFGNTVTDDITTSALVTRYLNPLTGAGGAANSNNIFFGNVFITTKLLSAGLPASYRMGMNMSTISAGARFEFPLFNFLNTGVTYGAARVQFYNFTDVLFYEFQTLTGNGASMEQLYAVQFVGVTIQQFKRR